MTENIFAVDTEIVVISGVCGQLGRRYAEAFLARGAAVAGIDLAESTVTADLTRRHGSRFLFCAASVTNIDALRAALDQIRRTLGEPTALINNAAIDSPPSAPIEETGPFESYPDASWDRVMDVNVKGVYLACKVFGSVMAANGRGSIVNVSSIYGVVSPDQSIYEYRRERGEVFYKPVAYAVSKSALLNLTRYLAVYWAASSVRVNTLVIAGVANAQDPAFVKAYCARIPVGRMAEEGDYEGPMLFLVSSASRYMTGAQLVIDGGWTAI